MSLDELIDDCAKLTPPIEVVVVGHGQRSEMVRLKWDGRTLEDYQLIGRGRTRGRLLRSIYRDAIAHSKQRNY